MVLGFRVSSSGFRDWAFGLSSSGASPGSRGFPRTQGISSGLRTRGEDQTQ